MRTAVHSSRLTHHVSRITLLSLLFAICYLLSACSLPGDAAPVVKIGVIAPFEGAGRPLGYAVLPAIKAAVAEANAGGELGPLSGGGGGVERRSGRATAAAQAQALALDPEVLAVVGPWAAETAAAAAPILAEAGMPVLTAADTSVPLPGEPWGDAALVDAATLAGNGCARAAGHAGRRYPCARPADAR